MSEVRHVFLQSRYRADWVIRVSRYKAVEVLENCLGIVILLTLLERSGFSQGAGNCLGSRNKSCKNRDEFINYTVRVIRSFLFFFYWVEIQGIGPVITTKQSYPLNLMLRD